MLEVTEWAREILRKAATAAARLNPDARVRLARAPAPRVELRAQVPAGALQTQLVEAPEPDDVTLEVDGVEVYVADGIEGMLDVEEPHDRIVLRPAGSTPNSR